jgi:hypothetical protein
MALTVSIPNELATRLHAVEDRLPEILELGLREWLTTPASYAGLNDLLETLASLPSPDEVAAQRPSALLQARIETLLEKMRDDGLSAEEQKEWERYEYIEHLIRFAKIRAFERQNRR